MTHRFAPAVTPPSPFPKGLSHPSHRGPVGTAADVASSLRGDSGLAAEGGVRGRSGSRSEGFGTRRPNSQLQHPPIAPFESGGGVKVTPLGMRRAATYAKAQVTYIARREGELTVRDNEKLIVLNVRLPPSIATSGTFRTECAWPDSYPARRTGSRLCLLPPRSGRCLRSPPS